MDLEQLIKGCMRQNRKAQEELYRRYKNVLFVLCLKYCRNHAEAEDNLHNAFIEIFTKIPQYKGNGSFEGWMKRITINKAIDSYKKTVHMLPVYDDILEDTTVSQAEIDVPLDYLLSIIQELPNQYRLVFCLYELDDYPHKEIAEMLSITESTSKSNLHKAKAILKQKIKANPSLKSIRNGA